MLAITPISFSFKWLIWFILLIAVCAVAGAAERTTVSILPGTESFAINGQVAYQGRSWQGTSIEGRLLNARVVNGIFDDSNSATRPFWNNPDGSAFDADANTNGFVAAMQSWRDAGLLCFTLNLQGGSPLGYQQRPYNNSAFNYDNGSRNDAYMARLKRILDEADRLGMVVILGYFYVHEANKMKDEATVITATKNATDWVIDGGYRNVLIEINNESFFNASIPNSSYSIEILRPNRVHELITIVKQQCAARNVVPLLAGTSLNGGGIPTREVVNASDFILLHGNGSDLGAIGYMFSETRKLFPAGTTKPMIVNEDDNFDFGDANNHFDYTLARGISWGYFDYRLTGDAWEEGFQSMPAEWRILGSRKVAFFHRLSQITDSAPISLNNLPPSIALTSGSVNGRTVSQSFTIGDNEITTAQLVVTATSTNQTVFPSANVVLTGSGANRTVTCTPTTAVGTSTITVRVSDRVTTVSASFTVTVTATAATIGNTAPTITRPADQRVTFRADGTVNSTGALSFTIGDGETDPAALVVSAASSNQVMVPNANVILRSSGANRTVEVTPVGGKFGSSAITLTVSDGSLTATSSFIVLVSNAVPTISTIPDVTVGPGSNSGALAFSVADRETPSTALVVTAASSNTILVPVGNIVLSGSGANRSVTITPVGTNGNATITLSVSDGNLVTVRSFRVTVSGTPVNIPPTISAIANQSVPANTATGALTFTVGDTQTAVTALTVTASSSVKTLVPDANVVLGGSGATRTVTVTPATGQSGTTTISLTVSDGALTATSQFTVTVAAAVNTPPTISTIANQNVPANTATSALTFTVGDTQTAATALTVTASSSVKTLVPDANVVLGGSGATRTVTVTPAAGQSGTTTITLTVSDGALTATSQFTVTVAAAGNQAPTISTVANQNIVASTTTGALAFTVGDSQTAATALTVTASSSVKTLVPDANLVLGGSGANRTVTVTPLATQVGATVITLTVSDGALTATSQFTVTVTATVNDRPTISTIIDQNIVANTATGALVFTVADTQTAATALMVTASSSVKTLVPDANVVLGGSGANRTVTVAPLAGQVGATVITLTVSDGALTATSQFTVTVRAAVNDRPTISTITNQTIPANSTSGALTFTVGDSQTAATALTVTASSSVKTLVPDANVVLGGSGANRTVTVSPLAGQVGTTVITLTVSDGALTATSQFSVTIAVDTPPTISLITNQTVPMGTAVGPLPFTVSDAETAATALRVTASSSVKTLVPDANVVLGGSGTIRTVTVTPLAGQTGTTVIELTVIDGSSAELTSFLVTVVAPPATPPAPTISGTSPNLNISGIAYAGATVTIYDTGVQVYVTTANGSGAWNWLTTGPFTTGVHAFTVTTTVSGITSAASPPTNVTIDPAVNSTSAPNDGGGAGGGCGLGGTTAVWVGMLSILLQSRRHRSRPEKPKGPR